MLISYKRGQTSVVLRVKILNASVTTGAGLTGLAYNLSALPNANAAASGGLLTAGTGTNQLNPSSGAIPVSGNVNVGSVNSGVIAADVWNATRVSYATSGTFGQGAASVQGNVTGSVASVSGNVSG